MITAQLIKSQESIETIINGFDVCIDNMDADNVHVYIVSFYGETFTKNLHGKDAAEMAADYVNRIIKNR